MALAKRAKATAHTGRGKETLFMWYPRIGGMDKSAGDAAMPILGKSGEVVTDRRDMLMRLGALAIGVLAFVGTAHATVADDDDGFYDDDGGGYYHDVWGGGYYDDDDWGGYDDDDDWGGDDDD